MFKLEATSLTKEFGRVRVLEDITFSVAEREFVVLVGPSGCGKSTLLRLIAGLEEITSGDLTIEGDRVNDVPASKRGLAMVFQSYALYPHMTVEQNMSVGLRIARVPKATIREKVLEAARILQLDTLLDRLPRQLSGGQRQRVAIGRAIVRDPKIFLFDEPLSNLDAALRLQMRLEIAKLRQQLDATMIYVTHDQVEAMTLADKIIVLNEGRIEQTGSPLDLYHAPRNRFVAGFIGSPRMNFLSGRLEKAQSGQAVVRLDCGPSIAVDGAGSVPAGEAITVGVRPEHVRISEADSGGGLSISVQVVEQLGAQTIVYAALDDGSQLTIISDGTAGLAPGQRIRIDLPQESLYLFDSTGDEIKQSVDRQSEKRAS